MEIMSNSSGCQTYHNINTNFPLGEDNEGKSVIDETIPTKFRQQTYDHENGCV